MRKHLILLWSIPLCLMCTGRPLQAVENDLPTAYNHMRLPALDETRIAHIENIVLHRDVATFLLAKGTICFVKPVTLFGTTHVTGAIFVGEGTFSFTPPTRIEQDQLAKFYGHTSHEQQFHVLFMRFTDSTFTELARQLSFVSDLNSRGLAEEKNYCEKYIQEPRSGDVAYSLLANLASAPDTGYFYAHISMEKLQPVFFIIDPHEIEEVRFEKRLSTVNYTREVVTQFRKRGVSAKSNQELEDKDIIKPAHYRIEASIESDGDFHARANVTYRVAAKEIRAIRFLMSSRLKVDSVLDQSDAPLPFVRAKESPELIAFLKAPQHSGDRSQLSVVYNGGILERDYGGFYLKSSNYWFPRYGFRNRVTYDLTFRTPESYSFVSIGKKIEEKTENGTKVSRWLEETPVVNASFNLGPFKQYDLKPEGLPPVSIFISEESVSFRNMEEEVGADIEKSVRFFSSVFAPYLFPSIAVTEIPFAHGESFPGLIHLSWTTFESGDSHGYSEVFRAHEVAHQWWGVTVGYKTYHDQWLSEGFAQYSGLWYMQWALKDDKKVMNILDQWKDEMFSNRKYIFGSGAEAGPIWLGYRTSSSETRGDYGLVVYRKGAFVLHMLRCMLLDPSTMSDSVFTSVLRKFWSEYAGKDATTEDFKRTIEKTTGTDMDWFFRQWVYDTALPTYKFSYSTSETPERKYRVVCRVSQQNVPADFRMPVLLLIKFSDDTTQRLRIMVDKPVTEITLPLMPSRPEEILFNDFNSVLAKVEYE